MCGCAARPVLEGDGYGGRYAIPAVQASLQAEPTSRNRAIFSLQNAGVAPFDVDGDGFLDFAEWMERVYARDLSDDLNGDGRIAAAEYSDSARAGGYAPRRTDRGAVLDQDRDGFISVGERARIEGSAFRRADQDADGRVSDEELGTTAPVVGEPRSPVSRLVGLTADEMLGRFGLSPANEEFVVEARLDGDVLETVVRLDRTEEGCTNGGVGILGGPTLGSSQELLFVFRDGRLSDVLIDRSSATEVVFRCFRPWSGDDGIKAVAYLFVLPLIPIAYFLHAPRLEHDRESAAVLATLVLGEPPPGGLDRFAASAPEHIVVSRGGGDDADLQIDGREGGFEATAVVRGGRVVALAVPLYSRCILEETRALRCPVQ